MGRPPGDAAQDSAALLQAQALSCERGGRRLFDGLDLKIAPGEIVWLRGTNGRGKTSLLRLLCGLSTPAAGRIVPGPRQTPSTTAGQCWIAHANALKEDLQAGEALRFLCAIAGLHCETAQIRQALERMGVLPQEHAPVRTLSQGQRRRVALARLALSLREPLWMLDEPFDALDDQGVQALKALLQEHARLHGATILSSHQDVGLQPWASSEGVALREFTLGADAVQKASAGAPAGAPA